MDLLKKYKPRTVADLIGNKTAIQAILNWIKEFDQINERFPKKRGLIISGPSGIGKTEASHVLLKDSGYTPVEFNTTNSKIKKDIKEQLLNVSNYSSVTGKKEKKAIIIDELDTIITSERGLLGELKGILECNEKPIILVCDRDSKKPKDLEKLCEHQVFNKPESKEFLKLAKRVMKAESISISSQSLNYAIEKTQEDIRKLMLFLEELTYHGKKIDHQKTKQILSNLSKKDLDLTLFEVVSKLMLDAADLTFDQVILYYSMEKSLTPLLIHENYLTWIDKVVKAGKKKGVTENQLFNIQHISYIMDNLSVADTIDTYIYANQEWAMYEIQSSFAAYGPVLSLKAFNEKYKLDKKNSSFQHFLYKFTCMLSKMSTRSARANILSNLRKKTRRQGKFIDMPVSGTLLFLRNFLHSLVIEKKEEHIKLAVELMLEYGFEPKDLDGLFRAYTFKGVGDIPLKYTAKMKSMIKEEYTVQMNRLEQERRKKINIYK